MASIFSAIINLLGKTERGVMSLGLAVMDNGYFVKCLIISAEKPYIRARFCYSVTWWLSIW